MGNTWSSEDLQKLRSALSRIGRNEVLRSEFVSFLKIAEKKVNGGGAIRDEVIGPIMDAIHTKDDLYEKILADGTKFQFLYRTKIARDFILSGLDHPTHVWEPQTSRLLQYLVGKTAKDVLIGGAYFGDHAILLGKKLSGSDRLVHCFEPDSDQSRMLAVNSQANDLDNLKIHRLGLWRESNRRLKLVGFDSLASSVVIESEEEGFETVSVDDYFHSVGRSCGLIMIDIEGGEFDVLQGAHKTIRNDKPPIIFEVHRDYVDWSGGLLETPVCSLLKDAGYEIFAIRDFNTNQEMGDRKIELIPALTVYLDGPPHGFNMLAVPENSLVNDPIFSIVDGVSPKLLRHKDPALHHPLQGIPD